VLKNRQVSFPGARRGGRRGISLFLGFLQEKFLASLSARVKAAAKAFLCPILDAVNVWLASPEDLAELLFTARRGTRIDASLLSQ